MNRLERSWYRQGDPLGVLLSPLAGLYGGLAALRRWGYRRRWLHQERFPVPVVVVGNISVGGTGKTPLVIHIARLMQSQGRSPGILSRGYGGSSTVWPRRVTAESDPAEVGDEPVLIAQRTGSPTVVGPRRIDSARVLLAEGCDILLSDDGLQHYALARDVEIAVVDGMRGLGNGRLLPAGPLREPRRRLAEVDAVVINGPGEIDGFRMTLGAGLPHRLADQETSDWPAFSDRKVHALAGIGNPERFFRLLEAHGVAFEAHVFPDHHPFRPDDLRFPAGDAVLMTEKDAVKCRPFAGRDCWYVPVEAELDAGFDRCILGLVERKTHHG